MHIKNKFLLAMGLLSVTQITLGNAYGDCVDKLNASSAERVKAYVAAKSAIAAQRSKKPIIGTVLLAAAGFGGYDVYLMDQQQRKNDVAGTSNSSLGNQYHPTLALMTAFVGVTGVTLMTAGVSHNHNLPKAAKVQLPNAHAEALLLQGELDQVDKKAFQFFYREVARRYPAAKAATVAAFLKEGNERETLCTADDYLPMNQILYQIVGDLQSGRPPLVDETIVEPAPETSAAPN